MLNEGNKPKLHYRDVLLNVFTDRRAKNPNYSMRAFARHLGISPATLSQVLSGKRDLSRANAGKVSDHLSLSPSETRQMLLQIQRTGDTSLDFDEYQLVQEDVFKMMSQWYYFAVLNLAKIPTHRADPKWIASRLGISAVEAKNAVMRLERLGYLEVADGHMIRTVTNLTTSNGVPSTALRSYHKQNLNLAAVSIDRDPLGERDFSSLTMAVEPEEIPLAKREIARFKKRVSKLFQSKKPTEVYTLAIQLFPVTIKGDPQ